MIRSSHSNSRAWRNKPQYHERATSRSYKDKDKAQNKNRDNRFVQVELLLESKSETKDLDQAFRDLRVAVETAKKKLEAHPNIDSILRAMDPFQSLKREIESRFNAQIVTNAWLKMYEINCQMKLLLPNSKGKLRAMFNAELPGAFISALNHFVKTRCPDLDYDWVAASYFPAAAEHSKDKDCLGDTFGVYAENKDKWLMDAPLAPSKNASPHEEGKSSSQATATIATPAHYHNDGDITRADNLSDLASRARKRFAADGIHLFVSDPGADVSNEYQRQEEAMSLLNLGQGKLMLSVLNKGGSCVMKMYTFTSPFTRSLIDLLSKHFVKVDLVKPETSRTSNGEVYLVAQGYMATPMDVADDLSLLTSVMVACKSGNVLPADGERRLRPIRPEMDAALLSAARKIHLNRQVDAVEHVLEMAERYGSDWRAVANDVCRDIERTQRRWMDNNPIASLRTRECLSISQRKR